MASLGTVAPAKAKPADEKAPRRAKTFDARRLAHREKKARSKGILEGAIAMLGKGDIAIDCGANVGIVTTQLAATGAEVHAFEPDPVAFGELSRKVADMPNVHLHHAAVGSQDGTVTLMRSTRFADDPIAATVSSTIVSGKRDTDLEGHEALEVPLVNLARFIRRVQKHGQVRLLKMDVEGEELTLLPHLAKRGALDVINCTLVETHQRKFPEKRRDFLSMRREISARYPASKVNLDWI